MVPDMGSMDVHIPDLPSDVHHAVCMGDNQALVIGDNGDDRVSVVLTLLSDGTIESEAPQPCPIPVTLAHYRVVRVGNDVYAYGGIDLADKTTRNDMYLYTADTGQWSAPEWAPILDPGSSGHTL
ncbi:hypothetical protein KIPB_009927 [Kipferlia bialata]|uniref:Uncharacterized protein n=1 Tax=Kipferlia bialata TaxID=797122 RepID=A0A9K3D2E1_9EUKA|nr:hypothetical protein KIPB_009927 [Kipferlia bialata]|eukprot:g9927.t1